MTNTHRNCDNPKQVVGHLGKSLLNLCISNYLWIFDIAGLLPMELNISKKVDILKHFNV